VQGLGWSKIELSSIFLFFYFSLLAKDLTSWLDVGWLDLECICFLGRFCDYGLKKVSFKKVSLGVVSWI
jgi:hypothetical protein